LHPADWATASIRSSPSTVATFESSWRHNARARHVFHCFVVDEAHHFGTGLRDEALDMSIAPMRLGLTATPPKGQRLYA